MCYHGGLAAASRVTEGIEPRDLLFPLLQQKRHWLSVTSSQAIMGLFVRMYLSCPGNSDTFRKEMFFLNILYWSSLEVGDFQVCRSLSLYFVASGSELLVCWVWHASCTTWELLMLKLLRSALALKMSYLRWEGIYLLHFLLGPFSVQTREKSAPVTFCDEFSLLKEIFKIALAPLVHTLLGIHYIRETCLICRK